MWSSWRAYVRPSLQEWLETDGLGGFASSTTAGIHTRRYHGWLFLSPGGAEDRFLALSKLQEVAHTADGPFDLSSNYHPGVLHPGGARNQWFFRSRPFPAFGYKVGRLFLWRELFMLKGEAGVFCRYYLEALSPDRRSSGEGVMLEARPLCNDRHYHHLRRAGWSPRISAQGPGVILRGHSACKDLLMVFHDASFQQDGVWYYDMLYPRERERGFDDAEDHFSPGVFRVRLSPDCPAYFWAGPLPRDIGVEEFAERLPRACEEARSAEIRRREALWVRGAFGSCRQGEGCQRDRRLQQGRPHGQGNTHAGEQEALTELAGDLAVAADQFVIKTGGCSSIVAGYHWFGEWGRDAFIAMPGLLLCTGRFDEARAVFRRFGDSVRGGLVPNRFEGGCGAAYNSVDASLWMVRALKQYERASGDTAFVREMLPAVEDVIQSYARGTLFGITVDSSGLLRAGSDDTQVTWMDARVNGSPVTPRDGCPVEVNALWIDALRTLARWLDSAGLPGGSRYRTTADDASREFRRAFTWPGVGLYDRISRDGAVDEVRPNQVIAAAAPGLELPLEVLREVFATAVSRLLTPRGLRTLAPGSPGYRGLYRGSPEERDSAYHQGTAWPFLVGALFDLALRLDAAAPRDGGACLSDFVLRTAMPGIVSLDRNPCLNTVFEVASGDFPYEAGGAVAQAWSVAEAARVINVAANGNYHWCVEKA